MTDLPRYKIGSLHDYDIQNRSYTPDLVADANGPLVQWADVSARLLQLEQEKATLLAKIEELRELYEANHG